MIHQAPLEAGAAWAYSSVVEHCVDIAGVASSILATPTIFSFAMSFSKIGILFPVGSNGSDLMLEANPHRPSLRLHRLRGKLDGLHPVSINIGTYDEVYR